MSRGMVLKTERLGRTLAFPALAEPLRAGRSYRSEAERIETNRLDQFPVDAFVLI